MGESGVLEECYGKKALAISRHINYLYEVNHNTVSNMEEQIYDFIIPLKNCGPFVEIIKNYIGLSHPNLDAEMKLLERDPERKFRLREHVPFEKVQALIGESFPSLENDEKEFLSNLLCLVANLYYGDSYRDQ